MTAYVTQNEVVASWGAEPPPDDAAALARITVLITVASAEIDAEVGFAFTAGASATHTVDGYGGKVLHIHGAGLAALTSLSILDVWGGTATLIDAADYLTETWDPAAGNIDHIVLGGTSTGYDEFPTGRRLVRYVASTGFAAVPANVKEAVIERVRQLFFADPTLIGGIQGPEEAGRVIRSVPYPDVFYRVIRHYQSRFATCWV